MRSGTKFWGQARRPLLAARDELRYFMTMDIETAEIVQGLVRMIDNVNERGSLGQLAFNGVMVLLASSRR